MRNKGIVAFSKKYLTGRKVRSKMSHGQTAHRYRTPSSRPLRVAWLVLGGTITLRTNSTDGRLRGRVQSIWGAPQVQAAPYATYDVPTRFTEKITENGQERIVEKTRADARLMHPEATSAVVELGNEYRKKGLLWYSTYKVGFQGDYVFHHSERTPQTLQLCLKYPAAQAVYDDLQFAVDGRPYVPVTEKESACVTVAGVAPDQPVKFHASYRSQGLESWKYSFRIRSQRR